jgi:hypothetical protein
MPGPGKKGGAKKKPSVSTSNGTNEPTYLADAVIGDIDNAEEWFLIILTLCRAFDLPGTPVSRCITL